ncbi:MAG TPA: hemin ABC transporter substrate-binding protein, partial [Vineibacter sp.]|nr:hemin ABC transporter substrate-binding protein [Vineibacter sp.]
MTFRRRSLVVSLAAAALAGAGHASARTAVADHAGRMIDIADASRVVAIGSSVTEIIYALGAGNRLIGADTTSMYPEAAMQLPR